MLSFLLFSTFYPLLSPLYFRFTENGATGIRTPNSTMPWSRDPISLWPRELPREFRHSTGVEFGVKNPMGVVIGGSRFFRMSQNVPYHPPGWAWQSSAGRGQNKSERLGGSLGLPKNGG